MATQLDDALNNIWQMRGVTGIALISGGQPLFRHMPGEIDPEDAQMFSRHLVQMVNTLATDGRRLRELYFGYSNGGLLVVTHQGAVLAVLLRDEEVLGYLAKIAGAFLREHLDTIQGVRPSLSFPGGIASDAQSAAVSLNTWHQFLDGLTRILTKVIGTTQASYVIARVLSQQGLSQTQDIPRDQYLELGLKVIAEVPNKSKQRSLADEVRLLAENLG